VAGAAILCDGLLVGRGVALVVATETARIIGMAEVIRVGSPSDFEVGKYIATIRGQQSGARSLDIRGALVRDIRILLLVEAGKVRRNLLSSFFIALIAGLN
jgi:hypothetical protein